MIISDNASSDQTQDICHQYAAKDSRIQYVRQDTNLGAHENFKYVLDNATGEYFMWNATDDLRTPDFIECNLEYLELNPTYVASTSPNCFEGQEEYSQKHIKFEIEGNLYNRLKIFIKNSWYSHGIFYALIRTSALRDCNFIRCPFIASDWSIDIHILTKGPIKRISNGLLISGKGGVSNSEDPYGAFRSRKIEYIFPLYEFSIRYTKTVLIADELSFKEKVNLLLMLAVLNFKTAYGQIYKPYNKLKKYIRPWYIKYFSKYFLFF